MKHTTEGVFYDEAHAGPPFFTIKHMKFTIRHMAPPRHPVCFTVSAVEPHGLLVRLPKFRAAKRTKRVR